MTGIRPTEQNQSRKHNFSSEVHEVVDYGFVNEKGGSDVGLNNSLSGPYSLPCCEQSQHAPSMPRLEGSMATSGVRGDRERLLLSANEVSTCGSVAPRLCLSASPPCSPRRGSGGYECLPSDTNAIFTHLRPGLRDGARCCEGGEGFRRIRFCPVGKITNGSSLLSPQPGSSL